MKTQGESGYFFLARVGLTKGKFSRYFLRFVPAAGGPIVGEEGTCLRVIQCEEDTPRVLPDGVRLGAFDAWQRARQDIWEQWSRLTDPANLQPHLRPLNRRVAEFLRKTPPPDFTQDQVDRLLDQVLSPWSFSIEREIREIFEDERPEDDPQEKARRLAEKIDEVGIEPFQPPEPLPPIQPEEVHLICWLALIGPEGK